MGIVEVVMDSGFGDRINMTMHVDLTWCRVRDCITRRDQWLCNASPRCRSQRGGTGVAGEGCVVHWLALRVAAGAGDFPFFSR